MQRGVQDREKRTPKAPNGYLELGWSVVKDQEIFLYWFLCENKTEDTHNCLSRSLNLVCSKMEWKKRKTT